ncbi:hypothetical protein ACO2Q8_07530 [Larkinella sp. VNQ87]|uniref:hypothetical protein n=1 Tax=Larkinella sp. VNQ87 TaxID=3400921 RepID=UPI003C0A3334
MRPILVGLVFFIQVVLVISCKTLNEVPQPIIMLSSTVPANALADGRTAYRFTAKVSPSVSEEYKTITFRSTGGQFASSDSATLYSVRVNEKGEASTDWIVPATGGDYYVSALVGNGSGAYQDMVKVTLATSIPLTDSITIAITGSDTVRANGQTILKINLKSNNPVIRQLVVSNNLGILSDGTAFPTAEAPLQVQLDQSGQGELYLRVGNRVDPYFIRAYLPNNPNAFKLFTFTPLRAYPDNIFVEPDSSFVLPNSQTPVAIYLVRNTGTVSIGTRIDYEVYQDIDGVKKNYSLLKNVANNFTDESGKAAVVFVADTSVVDRRKPVFLKASSFNDKGQAISKEIILKVK